MNPQLIIALVIAGSSAALGFGSAWKIQTWRAAAEGEQRAETALENERLVAKTRSRNDAAVIAATNAGAVRSSHLRAAADSSSDALARLRDEQANALRSAAASHEACLERATTLGELLTTMGKAGGELAAKADRHASDVQTLSEGWPK